MLTSRLSRRALRVLDGAVLIVDSVAACSHRLRLYGGRPTASVCHVLLCQQDGPGSASLEHVEMTLQQKLGTTPLFCQLPVGLGDDGDTGMTVPRHRGPHFVDQAFG